jgi:hypothetical protein
MLNLHYLTKTHLANCIYILDSPYFPFIVFTKNGGNSIQTKVELIYKRVDAN